MKIAVVSTDKTHVDEHFGRADTFLIYETGDAGWKLVAERQCIPLSVGDPDHPFDADRFEKIVEAIGDCERVYVTQIGEIPAAKLTERGISPRIFDGPIEKIPA